MNNFSYAKEHTVNQLRISFSKNYTQKWGLPVERKKTYAQIWSIGKK